MVGAAANSNTVALYYLSQASLAVLCIHKAGKECGHCVGVLQGGGSPIKSIFFFTVSYFITVHPTSTVQGHSDHLFGMW